MGLQHHSWKLHMSVPRKSPKKRVFQEEQLDESLDYDIIKSFTDFDALSPSGYTFTKYGDHIVYYQMEINELSVPEVAGCIPVDIELHVKLLFKGCRLYRYHNGGGGVPICFSATHHCDLIKLYNKIFLFLHCHYWEKGDVDVVK